jgi:hypothetical protein
MPGGGIYTWDTDAGLLGLYVDGRWIEGGAFYPQPLAVSQASRGSVLATIGGTDIVQLVWLGGEVPVNLRPVSVPVDVVLAHEEDYWAVTEASELGLAVDVYLDLPVTDIWSIAHADAGQTTWKTSRKLPYGSSLTGVSLASRPPTALIDGVAQTVVASSGPGAGEVYVPDSGDYAAIETPTGIAGSYLKLRYPPILRARLVGLQRSLRAHNALAVAFTVEEVMARRFEAVA